MIDAKSPYKPPSAHLEDRPSPWSSQIVRPRIMPRDTLDVVLTLVLFPYQLAVIFGPPCAVTWWLTRSVDATFLVYLVAYGCSLTFVVRSLCLDADGIRFRRVFGKPKLIPWNELEKVTVVSRRELVLRGWIW